MTSEIEVGVLLIALTLLLDWAEIPMLTKWGLHLRLGALLMLSAGQLLLAGTPVGDGIRWCITAVGEVVGKLVSSFMNWVLSLIPATAHTKVPPGTAEGVATAVVVIVCCWAVLRVALGALPKKFSAKELDWRGVYLAALIPSLIFGLPVFSQHAASDFSHNATTAIFQKISQAV